MMPLKVGTVSFAYNIGLELYQKRVHSKAKIMVAVVALFFVDCAIPRCHFTTHQ